MNEQVFNLIFGLAHQNVWLDRLGIFLAQYLPYILFLSALVLIFSEPLWRRRLFFFSHLALVLILARGMVVTAVHFFYPTLRPFLVFNITPLVSEAGPSFPSSHATIFFALATMMFYLNRKWALRYFLLAALMGAARVFVGVHWPLDIVVGALVGVLSGAAIYQLIEAYAKKIALPQTAQDE